MSCHAARPREGCWKRTTISRHAAVLVLPARAGFASDGDMLFWSKVVDVPGECPEIEGVSKSAERKGAHGNAGQTKEGSTLKHEPRDARLCASVAQCCGIARESSKDRAVSRDGPWKSARTGAMSPSQPRARTSLHPKSTQNPQRQFAALEKRSPKIKVASISGRHHIVRADS